MRTRNKLAGTALALGFVFAAAPASAASPYIVEKYEDTINEPASEFESNCGINAVLQGSIRGTVRIGEEFIHLTEHSALEVINSDTGQKLTWTWNLNYKSTYSETTNPDGTVTYRYSDVFAGVPERWQDSRGKTIVKDRGFVRFEGTVVVDVHDPADPLDDEVLSADSSSFVHGPHPLLSGDLDREFLCSYLTE